MQRAEPETRQTPEQQLPKPVSLPRTRVDRGTESQKSRSQVFSVSEATLPTRCRRRNRPVERPALAPSPLHRAAMPQKPCASRSPLCVESPRKKPPHRAPRQLTAAPPQQMQPAGTFDIYARQTEFPEVARMSPLVPEEGRDL